jgi:hypothetical protein
MGRFYGVSFRPDGLTGRRQSKNDARLPGLYIE